MGSAVACMEFRCLFVFRSFVRSFIPVPHRAYLRSAQIKSSCAVVLHLDVDLEDGVGGRVITCSKVRGVNGGE